MSVNDKWLSSVGQLLEVINNEATSARQPIWVEDADEVLHIVKRISIDDDAHVVLHLGI